MRKYSGGVPLSLFACGALTFGKGPDISYATFLTSKTNTILILIHNTLFFRFLRNHLLLNLVIAQVFDDQSGTAIKIILGSFQCESKVIVYIRVFHVPPKN